MKNVDLIKSLPVPLIPWVLGKSKTSSQDGLLRAPPLRPLLPTPVPGCISRQGLPSSLAQSCSSTQYDVWPSLQVLLLMSPLREARLSLSPKTYYPIHPHPTLLLHNLY